AASTSGLRGRVARIVESTLGQGGLADDQDLLSLGANSLDMIRIVNQLEQEMGVRPRITDLYEDPTIAGLVRMCGGREEARGSNGVAPSDAGDGSVVNAADDPLANRERGLRGDRGELPAIALSM